MRWASFKTPSSPRSIWGRSPPGDFRLSRLRGRCDRVRGARRRASVRRRWRADWRFREREAAPPMAHLSHWSRTLTQARAGSRGYSRSRGVPPRARLSSSAIDSVLRPPSVRTVLVSVDPRARLERRSEHVGNRRGSIDGVGWDTRRRADRLLSFHHGGHLQTSSRPRLSDTGHAGRRGRPDAYALRHAESHGVCGVALPTQKIDQDLFDRAVIRAAGRAFRSTTSSSPACRGRRRPRRISSSPASRREGAPIASFRTSPGPDPVADALEERGRADRSHGAHAHHKARYQADHVARVARGRRRRGLVKPQGGGGGCGRGLKCRCCRTRRISSLSSSGR